MHVKGKYQVLGHEKYGQLSYTALTQAQLSAYTFPPKEQPRQRDDGVFMRTDVAGQVNKANPGKLAGT